MNFTENKGEVSNLQKINGEIAKLWRIHSLFVCFFPLIVVTLEISGGADNTAIICYYFDKIPF